MSVDALDRAEGLARRLERYRAATAGIAGAREGADVAAVPGRPLPSQDLAERLAGALDGEVVRTPLGAVVRCDSPSRPMAIDRTRLATLPGHPDASVPLICLDTETTGLATAAGTVAFLIGLGWWEGDRFRQVQLLLPDHGDEPGLLATLASLIPRDAWLVTYNGRGFDWPLLVTRYRMNRRAAPEHAGHLDLLPVVRRLFRHRLVDARLGSAETGLLGLQRHGDVDGWEIPGRYLGFLRGGPVLPLVDVVRHNDQDVRSLARLLVLLERDYAGPTRGPDVPAGDLAGLARSYARLGRLVEALGCYDDALLAPIEAPVALSATQPLSAAAAPGPEPWWSPRATADFGGRPARPSVAADPSRSAAFAAPWSTERIAIERAYLLRRLGRWAEAIDAWDALASGTGRTAVIAAIELAKLHEHRRRDARRALEIVATGLTLAMRRRRLGRPEPRLEADLERRRLRLERRAAASAARRIRQPLVVP